MDHRITFGRGGYHSQARDCVPSYGVGRSFGKRPRVGYTESFVARMSDATFYAVPVKPAAAESPQDEEKQPRGALPLSRFSRGSHTEKTMRNSPDRAKQLNTLSTFLREENTLALATVDKHGGVSVAPLFYLVDEYLSLFWLSSPSSLHSQNLKRTPSAAATVYRHTENWKDIRGVQMRGLVTVITDRRRRRLLIKSYSERFKLGALFLPAIRRCSLYEFRPDFFRFIDNSKGFGYKFEIIPENTHMF